MKRENASGLTMRSERGLLVLRGVQPASKYPAQTTAGDRLRLQLTRASYDEETTPYGRYIIKIRRLQHNFSPFQNCFQFFFQIYEPAHFSKRLHQTRQIFCFAGVWQAGIFRTAMPDCGRRPRRFATMGSGKRLPPSTPSTMRKKHRSTPTHLRSTR